MARLRRLISSQTSNEAEALFKNVLGHFWLQVCREVHGTLLQRQDEKFEKSRAPKSGFKILRDSEMTNDGNA